MPEGVRWGLRGLMLRVTAEGKSCAVGWRLGMAASCVWQCGRGSAELGRAGPKWA